MCSDDLNQNRSDQIIPRNPEPNHIAFHLESMALNQTSFHKIWTGFQRLFGDGSVKLQADAVMIRNCDLLIHFGCSTGLMCPSCKSTFQSDYIGIDVDENALEVARDSYPDVEFSSLDRDALVAKVSSYDFPVLMLSNVLHHMYDLAVSDLFSFLRTMPSKLRVVALDPEAKRRSYSIIFGFSICSKK